MTNTETRNEEARGWIRVAVTQAAQANAVTGEADAIIHLLTLIRAAGNAYGALCGVGTGQTGTDGRYDARIGDELEALAQQLVVGAQAKEVLP